MAQNDDAVLIKKIYEEALANNAGYNDLDYLCKHTKGRLSGTAQLMAAIAYTKQVMDDCAFDSVYLQEVMVPRWVRGKKEYAGINSKVFGTKELSVCALGLSLGTGEKGIWARVIEVNKFRELDSLGFKKIKGNIVFFNRPMDIKKIFPNQAYGEAVEPRANGAIVAAKYGAIGVIVRSVTTSIDTFPHTGVMHYDEGTEKIPAISVCTQHAEFLSHCLKVDPDLILYFKTDCRTLPPVKAYNVIGEIRGSELPDEIITVAGHLDSWDNTEGAHDNGAGCVQSIDVLRLFQKLGIKPKRTIRAVMFMDEEITQQGGRVYSNTAKSNNEKHYAAVESDRGGFSPHGFTFAAAGDTLQKLINFKKYFEPYGVSEFFKGYAGVDINPLGNYYKLPLIGYYPDSQRYFDYHHCANDTFDKVNKRELQLGSATIASLVYLIDKYGYE